MGMQEVIWIRLHIGEGAEMGEGRKILSAELSGPGCADVGPAAGPAPALGLGTRACSA